MTINKYFVLVPKAVTGVQAKTDKVINQKEAQRQKLVKQAQQLGGM